MSDRFPPIPASSQSEELKALFGDYVKKHHSNNPNFRYTDDQGQLVGPFAIAGYTPDIGVAMMEFGDILLNQKDLSTRERELAILAVCGVFDAPFIAYAHKRVALASGLEKHQVEAACVCKTPLGLTQVEEAVYNLSLELAQTRAVLADQSWHQYKDILGKERCLRVAHVTGLYIYTATFMRVANLSSPE